MDGEDIDQAGERKDTSHLVLGCGKQQVSRGAPRLRPGEHQSCNATGVYELEACEIDDDRPSAPRDCRQRSSDTRGLCHVKLAVQHDDSRPVAFFGMQFHSDHGRAFPLEQQGGDST